MAAAAILGGGFGGGSSGGLRGFTYERPRETPTTIRALGWQRAPGKGKRRATKRKYIRRASGYRGHQ